VDEAASISIASAGMSCRSGALILMYHRIAEAPTDPYLLSVSPRHFAEQFEILGSGVNPMRLAELVRAVTRGEVPERAVVVSFDDGYADNLLNAKPLLERYGIPATVFVISGYVGSQGEFWWDELDRLVLQPGRLPETLQICVNGRQYEWWLEAGGWYAEDTFLCHRGWAVEHADDPTARQRLYRALHALLKPLGEADRQRTLDELRAWAGGSTRARASHRILTSEEVIGLAQGGLIEVGAHSVSHPLLPTLTADEQRDEIVRSKVGLEEVLGQPVRHFSYPFGGRTAETIALVRDAGYTCACAGLGTVRNGADPFQLPRVWIRDWDGDEFERRLSEWFLD
jgi:peptidoglycan/xylan/chitin deacetylase (PgdA/CDA1 family)